MLWLQIFRVHLKKARTLADQLPCHLPLLVGAVSLVPFLPENVLLQGPWLLKSELRGGLSSNSHLAKGCYARLALCVY